MLMSDNFIRSQCETPTHIYIDTNGTIEYSSAPFPFHHQEAIYNYDIVKFKTNTSSLSDRPIPVCIPISQKELRNFKPMISPFVNSNVKEVDSTKVISYGLSSGGYDVRLANTFKIFTNIRSGIIDPLNMSDDCYVDHTGEYVIIPPNSYALGHTIEYFNIPRDVLVVCLGKSSLARAGLGINCTPVEPGFKGEIVLEITNFTNLPIKVYANQGISQFLFYKLEEPCKTSYADKNGKYQGQTGITTVRI